MQSARLFIAILLVTAVSVLGIPNACDADDLAQAGRDVTAKYGNAVITLQLVVKTMMSMEGEEGEKEESKAEATGVIIDPTGLVVASLTQTDPSETINKMLGGRESGFKFSTEITDLKIRLADGKELPAKVVLRDKDLDLAFVRPVQKPAEPLPTVDLTKTTAPAVLDQTMLLYRLGTVASRALAVSVDRIVAIVDKPRTFYVPGIGGMASEAGAPVFAMDGNIVGFLVVRSLPTRSGSPFGGMTMSSSMSSMGIMPIVLPASDVLEAAKQAPESAKAVAEPKPAATKPAAKPAKPAAKPGTAPAE